MLKGSAPDPAYPERRPDFFERVRCGACVDCYIDKRNGRCPCGGPFDAELRVNPGAAVSI